MFAISPKKEPLSSGHPFISHGTRGLKASFKGRRVVQVDHRGPRDVEVLVVLGRPDSAAHARAGGLRIHVSHQDQVVIEGRRVQAIGQMVHEMPRAAFDEAMIIVKDVARAVVEHASAAAEGGELVEGVQGRWCMRWLQMPSKAGGMCRVVEERQIRLSTCGATDLAHPPSPVAVRSQVRTVPGSEKNG